VTWGYWVMWLQSHLISVSAAITFIYDVQKDPSSKNTLLDSKFRVTHFLECEAGENYNIFLHKWRIFPCSNLDTRHAGRILLGDNRYLGSHAVADQVPISWRLDFNWTPLYIFIYLTTCVLNYDLCKTWLALEFLEHNYRVSWGINTH